MDYILKKTWIDIRFWFAWACANGSIVLSRCIRPPSRIQLWLLSVGFDQTLVMIHWAQQELDLHRWKE